MITEMSRFYIHEARIINSFNQSKFERYFLLLQTVELHDNFDTAF